MLPWRLAGGCRGGRLLLPWRLAGRWCGSWLDVGVEAGWDAAEAGREQPSVRRSVLSVCPACSKPGEKSKQNNVDLFKNWKTEPRKKAGPFSEPRTGYNERTTNRSHQFVVPVFGARKRPQFWGQTATPFLEPGCLGHCVFANIC